MTTVLDKAADAAPTADDILYLINDPGGTPGDRKVTVGNLASPAAFSALYATASALATVAGDVATVAGDLATHAADTTNVHGIVDTAALVTADIFTDAGGGNLLPPERRFSFPNRATTMFLARGSAAVTRELLISDSFGHTGQTAPEQDSWLSVYEAEMALAYNILPRTSGFVPVELWTPFGGVDSPGIAWDDIPAGQNVERGMNYANKRILAGQYAATTREGTGVTIYYTAQQTGGAVVDVDINGTASGTIDSRDAGLPAATYDSGRSVYIANPQLTLGPITVTLTHNGTGTAFEVEGAYFHADNDDNGHMALRADRSGLRISQLIDPARPSVLQVIANVQPEIITILAGVNDYIGGAASAATLAADLTTLLSDIRAEYGTWDPAIRYVFQPYTSDFLPATWLTDYRDAVRAVCVAGDVMFLDASELVGPYTAAIDYLDFSDDGLHPNDYGADALARLVASASMLPVSTRTTPFDLATDRPQLVTGGAFGATTLKSAFGTGIAFGRDTGAATADNVQLGYVGFVGAANALGSLVYGAAVKGKSEEAWTSTNHKAGLRWLTTPTGGGAIAERGGVTGDGTLYVGLTPAAAVVTIDSAGSTVLGAVTSMLISDPTYTSAPAALFGILSGRTITADYTNQVMPRTIHIAGTRVMEDASVAGLNANVIIDYSATYKNASGVAAGLASSSIGSATIVLFDRSTVQADDATIHGGIHTTVFSAPQFGIVGAGSYTSLAYTGFGVAPVVNSGTMITGRGIQIADPTGAGAVTTFYGIDIATLAKATTSIGIRNRGTLRQTVAATFGADAAASTGVILDVHAGQVAYRRSTKALVTGNNNDLVLPATPVVVLTDDGGAPIITGWAAPQDGIMLRMVYLGTQNCTIAHQNAGSVAANQITCNTGANIVSTGAFCADLWYDTGTSKWFVCNTSL